MAEFWHMGGYAAFVWPVYALAGVVMVALVVSAIRRARRTEADLKAARSALRQGN